MIRVLTANEPVDRIRHWVSQQSSVKIAAPFWGAESIERLGLPLRPTPEDITHQIICNLQSGACNPEPIKQLNLSWDIRSNPRLHAKVYLFPTCAIVGSANPSTNGLMVEFEAATGWHEVCLEIHEQKKVDELHLWFDKLFTSKESVAVDDQMLADADKQYQRNRQARLSVRLKDRPLSRLRESTENDDIHVFVYNDDDLTRLGERYRDQLKDKGINDMYELDSDTSKVDYEWVIDCLFHYSRTGRLALDDPTQCQIFPALSKKIEQNLWALPARRVEKGLDDESIRFIKELISKKPPPSPGVVFWTLTLGELKEGAFDNKQHSIGPP